MGDLRGIYKMSERAANMFQSNGSADSAVSSLEKAAKILESQVPIEALNLYKHAAEISIVCIFMYNINLVINLRL